MRYDVEIRNERSRSLAAVRERMTPSEIPKRVIPQLTRAYAAMADAKMGNDGQNVFIYRPAPGGLVDVETGVGVAGAFDAHGDLVHVLTPAGAAAATTHWGDYAQLSGAHEAILAWCKEHSRTLSGVSWEVYGHWSDDPAKVSTDVFYLLVPEGT